MKNQNEENSLTCSVPLCNAPWSIQLGAPKCSFHQWGVWPSQYSFPETTNEDRNMSNDPKWWAKKILRDNERGIPRSALQVTFAKQALRIDV
jgi:hypothetical protein